MEETKAKEIKNKLFITGIIKEKNKRGNDIVAAANVYDIETKSGHIESIDNCFPVIDYRVYQSIEDGVIPQQEKKLAPLYQ